MADHSPTHTPRGFQDHKDTYDGFLNGSWRSDGLPVHLGGAGGLPLYALVECFNGLWRHYSWHSSLC